jgi:hypothetical protein
MTLVNVLYLPRDERLRTIVRTTLDFVEEVYKPEFLASIRFVSYDLNDDDETEHVKHIAYREGFAGLVIRRGRELELIPLYFFSPHSDALLQYAWIPVIEHMTIPEMYDVIVHEITHLALVRLPEDLMEALVNSFRKDTNLDNIVGRHGFPPDLVQAVSTTIQEVTVLYITYNYFRKLKKSPEIPTTQTYIKDYALGRYRGVTTYRLEPKHVLDVLAKLYYIMARTDLASLRVAIHQAFETMIKKFPADVHESNKAKYEILYRERSI